MDSCRTVSHTFNGNTGGQLGEARHLIGLPIVFMAKAMNNQLRTGPLYIRILFMYMYVSHLVPYIKGRTQAEGVQELCWRWYLGLRRRK
jgi:hypothetical protein